MGHIDHFRGDHFRGTRTRRAATFTAIVMAGTVLAGGIASAGALPGFKQIGCWNKVVVACEATDGMEARAACQHQGFASCNRDFEEDSRVSLDRIRDALPTFTASRVVIRQSAATEGAGLVKAQ